jgi:hypothetical protein
VTAPTPPTEWWTRPSRVLPFVFTIIVLVALLTPQRSEGRLGDSRLSSTLAGSMGARVLADLSHRLGWRVERDSTDSIPSAGGRAIHAVLAPPLPISREQAHALLETVRAGDGLLLVLDDRDPLSDSLGVTHFPFGGVLAVDNSAPDACADQLDLTPTFWPDGRVHVYPVRFLHSEPAGVTTFGGTLTLDRIGVPGNAARRMTDPAVGFPLGKGRVVVVGDPDLLRNDVLRQCKWGADVIAVRMLEWLRAGGEQPRSTIIFDEYHQGFGRHVSTTDVIFPFLVDHPVGRFVLALVAAGLLLLLARAPRPIVPVEVERIERRDPLEQVDALSHAYEQVKATRTIVARLVRGVRWRAQHGGFGARASSDTDFLDAAAQRYPALSDDVGVIRHALDTPSTDRDLVAVGAALHRLEDTLTSPIS